MNTLQVLGAHGIAANAQNLVNAAAKVGVPLHIAAAFVARETGGLNVYGHDRGGIMSGAGAVTPENYKTFRALLRQGHTSNGVGPLQITWSGFFTDADKKGLDLSNPFDNLVYGLGLIKGYLKGSTSPAAIVSAGKQYNGALSYGIAVSASAALWRVWLASATPAVTPASSLTKFPLPATDWYGVNDRTSRSHSGARASDQSAIKRIQLKLGGLRVDGIFGASTDAAVRKYQQKNNTTLRADGKVGPSTWKSLKL